MNDDGHTLVELLVAIVVGSIAIVGIYEAYMFVARWEQRFQDDMDVVTRAHVSARRSRAHLGICVELVPERADADHNVDDGYCSIEQTP